VLSEGGKISCRPEVCAIIRGIRRFGSAWQLIVVAYLLDGPLRFNELLRMGRNDSLNARTLSRALKRLTEQQLVHREILESQPVAIRYSLTSRGKRLIKLLEVYQQLDEYQPSPEFASESKLTA
jgi:DNA-binding HxlR family transcriptional regulator